MLDDDASSRAEVSSDSSPYDKDYYDFHLGDRPYQKGDPEWESFYGSIAEEICRSLNPRTVFDAGCAIGFLVEAFWDRGVEAHGRDISEYAIGQVRRDAREYCEIGSLEDEIEGRYDLVCCIEVLEHMDVKAGDAAIRNLTSAADRVLFSSSPDDFEEPTHVNVRPPIHWIRRFAQEGFRPVAWYDATFVCPHALLFERTDVPVDDAYMLAMSHLVHTRVKLAHESGERIDLNVRLSQALQELWDSGQEAERRVAELQDQLWSQERQIRQAKAELDDLTDERSRLLGGRAVLEARIEDLSGEADQLRVALAHHVDEAHRQHARADAAEARVASMEASFFWRLTGPARRFSSTLPSPVRRVARRSARTARRATSAPVSAAPEAGYTRTGLAGGFVTPAAAPDGPPTTTASRGPVGHDPKDFQKKYQHLEPLRVYRSAEPFTVVNVVTDSVSPGSLFGGVGTALILGGLVAERVGSHLRVVTRNEPGDVETIARLLRANNLDGVDLTTDHIPSSGNAELPVGPSDIFIPTAWWTGVPTVAALGHRRVVYLLQEDERIFYPLGDEYLRCAEFLSDPRLRCVVNSRLLFQHLTEGPEPIRGISERSVYFEPAFPSSLFYDDPRSRQRSDAKRVLLMYARPNNVRNLFWRGVEVLQRALSTQLIDAASWRIVMVGKDIPPIDLPGRPELVVAENLGWEEYAALVRSTHIGMSLIYSPHPSYPPLDLAASGAVVLTNSFGETKCDLSTYSGNIICAPPTVTGLLDGLAQALALAEDEEKRAANVANSHLNRDWRTALSATVDQILDWVG